MAPRSAGLAVEEALWVLSQVCELGGVERWEVVFGTDTSQALVLGKNKTETFLA